MWIEHAGRTLVVRLTALPTEEDVLGCRERLQSLLDRQNFDAVAFDLASVPTVRSSLVALMVLIRRSGIGVEVLAPSPHVRDCLRIMHLDQLLTLRGEGTEEVPG